MGPKSLFLLYLGALIVVDGTTAGTAPLEEALPLLFKAASVDDYANYEALSDILGLTYSNFRANPAMEQGVQSPRVLGVAQEIDLKTTTKTSISRSIKTVSWRGFIPNGEEFQRATLQFYVNIHELCITPHEFSITFFPINKSYTTDFGPLILERVFPGPRNRAAAATFSENGCASLIMLYQNP